MPNLKIDWKCKNTWKTSSYNTLWCLVGCSIGDFGTILFFQWSDYQVPALTVMSLAIINGLITSVILETIILSRQMILSVALKTALGMSFISMVAMEVSMNATDLILVGEAKLNVSVVPIMLLAGFLTPLPYNYWRLKAYGRACH
jgi:hypothetical protein